MGHEQGTTQHQRLHSYQQLTHRQRNADLELHKTGFRGNMGTKWYLTCKRHHKDCKIGCNTAARATKKDQKYKNLLAKNHDRVWILEQGRRNHPHEYQICPSEGLHKPTTCCDTPHTPQNETANLQTQGSHRNVSRKSSRNLAMWINFSLHYRLFFFCSSQICINNCQIFHISTLVTRNYWLYLHIRHASSWPVSMILSITPGAQVTIPYTLGTHKARSICTYFPINYIPHSPFLPAQPFSTR